MLRLTVFILLVFITGNVTAQGTEYTSFPIERLLYFNQYESAGKKAEESVSARLMILRQAPATTLPGTTTDSVLQMNLKVLYLVTGQAQKDTLAYAMALAVLGRVRSELARYDAADSLFTLALPLFERNRRMADSNYLKVCTWAASNCRSLADYAQAESILQRGLKAAETCKNTPHEGFKSGLLLEYANWDTDMSRYGQATLHYRQALAVAEQLHGKKSPEWAAAAVDWAYFQCNMEGAFKKSAATLEPALAILEKHAHRYPVTYAKALALQGQLYSWGLARHSEAPVVYQKGLDFCVRQLPPNHTMRALFLVLAASYQQYYTPDFFKADTLRKQALAIYEQHFGANHPECITVLRQMAEWQGTLGYQQTVKQLNETANNRLLRIFRPGHPQINELNLKLAENMMATGDVEGANRLIDSVEMAYRRKFGLMHGSRFMVLKTRTKLAGSSFNLFKKDSLCQQMLMLAEQLYGRNSIQWWNTLGEIAGNYSLMGRYAQADSLLQAIAQNDRAVFGEKAIAIVGTKLSQYYLFCNRYPDRTTQAAAQLDHILQMTESCIGRDNWWYLLVLRNKVELLAQHKKIAEAEKALSELEKTTLKIFGPYSLPMQLCLEKKIKLLENTAIPADIIPYRRQLLELQYKIGNDVAGYYMNNANLAEELANVGAISEARELMHQSLLATQQLGEANGVYYLTRLRGASLYIDLGDFKQAKICLDEAANSVAKMGNLPFFRSAYLSILFNYCMAVEEFGNAQTIILEQIGAVPDGAVEPGNCNQYGRLLLKMERYQEAEEWFRKGLKIAEDKKNDEYFNAFFRNLSQALRSQDKFKDAVLYSEKSVTLSLRKHGPDHPDYAFDLLSHASLLSEIDDYQTSQRLYRQGLDIIARTEGVNSLKYMTPLNNLGVDLFALNRYSEALDTFKRVMQIAAQKLGVAHPVYVLYRQNIADALISGGKYNLADSLLQLNLQYWKNRDPKSLRYADVLQSQGDLLRLTGQYHNSIKLYQQVLALKRAILPASSTRIAASLGKISLVYTRLKNYPEAFRYEREALQMDSMVFGARHVSYANHLFNIGKLYYLLRQPKSAEALLLRNLEIYRQVYGTEADGNMGYTWSILAGVYQQMGDLKRAEEAARKGLAIIEKNWGPQDYDAGRYRMRLGHILMAHGSFEEGVTNMEQGRAILGRHIKTIRGYMSAAEQSKLTEEYKLDICSVAALEYRLPQLAGICYDNALMFKGIGLHSGQSLRDALYQSKDTLLLGLYDQYLLNRKSIAAEYRLRPSERRRVDSLEEASRQLERRLMAGSAAYRNHAARFEANWQAIQAKLAPGEAAIEFIRYNRLRVVETDTFLYAALVLLPNRKMPVFVPLCREKDIDTLRLEHVRQDGFPTGLYRPSELSRAGSTAKRFDLYDLIWRPIDSLLAGVHRIYYAPDGLLHRISFAALSYKQKDAAKVFLTDRFDLIQLVSTRELLETPETKRTWGNGALVVGAIDYGNMPAQADERSGVRPFVRFDALEAPGEEGEYSQACHLFTENGQQVTTLSGSGATEAAVMDTLHKSVGYRTMCFITHGFFLPDRRYEYKMRHLYTDPNPMQRSGLVFAGVNATDSVTHFEEDGLLTAQDFAGLNLKGTEMVILPACQSGLGDLVGSEGVFGLQRAFQEAGVRYMIISLWDLPNEKTTLFMKTFYQLWLKEGKSAPDAFRITQRQLRNTKDWDVADWAGLVFIGK